jgi:hypothetical protein
MENPECVNRYITYFVNTFDMMLHFLDTGKLNPYVLSLQIIKSFITIGIANDDEL